jgi:predicted oxidoreductase
LIGTMIHKTVNGVDHTGVLATQYAVKAVGPLQIWIDDDGNRVDQPTPPCVPT